MKKILNVLKDGAGLITIFIMFAALIGFIIWSSRINDAKVALVTELENARLNGKDRVTVVYGGKKYEVDVDRDDVRKSTIHLKEEEEEEK